MKSNLLLSRIYLIQDEYKELLSGLLPKLKTSHCKEALDEINLFWIRHIEVVQLYLKMLFPSEESYVFTAATYMDFEDKEHLPFLLVGKRHVLDDPLSKYSEICNKMPEGKDADYMYEQICMTATDNLKILEKTDRNILILPLRILNQSSTYSSFFDLGEEFFVSLFNGIESLDDYFEKCITIEDIKNYACENLEKMVRFSEGENLTLPFEERFKNALADAKCMVDVKKPDSYNFFMLVFGFIQQAIDVIISCIEYGCNPYIRFPVALHYISLLSESMVDIEQVITLRFKMSMAFVIYRLCDKGKLASVRIEDFLKKNKEYDFNDKLFSILASYGINEKTFLNYTITQVVLDELEKFYEVLSEEGSADNDEKAR